MSKHTPGPFTIEYKKRMSIEGNTLVVVNPERFPFAFVPAWDNPAEGEEDGREEAQANAYLIAAAPELLEAAKEALRLFRYNVEDAADAADFAAAVEIQIEAAIKKAEGEDNVQR